VGVLREAVRVYILFAQKPFHPSSPIVPFAADVMMGHDHAPAVKNSSQNETKETAMLKMPFQFFNV